jgi:hypothetical protein
MKVISFDVGIKNMAYCIFDCSQCISITDWDVLNLVDDETTIDTQLCNQQMKTKTKTCNKKAKYKKGTQFFCKKHAEDSKYLLPSKENSITKMKQKKKDALLSWGKQHFLFLDASMNMNKNELVDTIQTFLNTNCLEPIVISKKNASECDLITIGRSMSAKMDTVNLEDIKEVIIENQISPIANRMKTIQGMLAQYFIIKHEDSNISFISSANKLKPFIKKENSSSNVITNDKVNPNYKEHKHDSVQVCKKLVDHNFPSWKDTLTTKKKDDLADACLQGLWFLMNKNKISYADDLKINSVSLS